MPNQRSSSSNDISFNSWFSYSYIIDYITLIILGYLLLHIVVLIQPNDNFINSMKYLPDQVIKEYYNYPLVKETWSGGIEFSIFVGFPVSIITLSQYWIRSFHDFHNAILGYLFSWILSSITSELFKNTCAFPRPNYLARIQTFPEDHKEYIDARMSFPSGHAASFMSTLLFISLYLYGKIRPFDKESNTYIIHILIIIFPTLLAIYLSFTRIIENQHFAMDVIVGWIIGIAFSFIIYNSLFYTIWQPLHGNARLRYKNNDKLVI